MAEGDSRRPRERHMHLNGLGLAQPMHSVKGGNALKAISCLYIHGQERDAQKLEKTPSKGSIVR